MNAVAKSMIVKRFVSTLLAHIIASAKRATG